MKLSHYITKDHIEGAAMCFLSNLEFDPRIEVYKLNSSFKVIIHPVAAIFDDRTKFADTFEFTVLFSEDFEKLFDYLREAYEYCLSIEIEDNTNNGKGL